jgi:hypothetical protein
MPKRFDETPVPEPTPTPAPKPKSQFDPFARVRTTLDKRKDTLGAKMFSTTPEILDPELDAHYRDMERILKQSNEGRALLEKLLTAYRRALKNPSSKRFTAELGKVISETLNGEGDEAAIALVAALANVDFLGSMLGNSIRGK